MTITARQLMETDLVTVTPETPLLQIHQLFVDEEINGAPVVDDDENLVGIISSLDILRAVREEYDVGATVPIYFRDEMPYSSPDWLGLPEDFQDRLSELSAADAMIREPITVSADTDAAEVARLMRSQRIHRVLVVDDGKLAGIITTFDFLPLLFEEPSAAAGQEAP